jgi:hypothetical protein
VGWFKAFDIGRIFVNFSFHLNLLAYV